MAHTVFPSDLVQAQRDWNDTYAQLAAGQAHYTALRRRLLRLSSGLVRHPFWTSDQGRSATARVELRRWVRAQEEAGTHGRSPHRAAVEHPAVRHRVDR
ncbi:hypothetical protein [Streptomyces sp. NBC_00829]|uniref:hypothetical protein n=1 Tax=Streptomyces sp. NBC_00829 TaxID=2903679 RepID=UPI00386CD3C7|nr:hypothetical protein OG293_16825 [Streptomyces sp. NBC_00829]